jgi:DNA-binding response OmpR family regulator
MRLLLIEDYPPLQKALVQGLQEAGFAVDATGDGEEGLWFAQSNDYDVIVLDLLLPKVAGLTILRQLRQEGRQTHVLILTAKDTLSDRVQGLNLGADDYMIKPFAFEELLARIRSLVRRQYHDKNPSILIEDLCINTVSQRVERAGIEVQLTPREFALLEYLARRSGKVVARSDIWEHVYDFHAEASSNVVDVYIGYLRRKIEREGRPPLIHTLRGRGYCLGNLS